MRIVFATIGYKPAWKLGGPIHSVAAIAERLVRRGHEVSVVCSNSNLEEDLDVATDTPIDVDGVEVYYFEHQEFFKRSTGLRYFSQSVGFLYSKRMRPRLDLLVPRADIVHTQLPFNYPTYAAAQAAFRHRKPLLYHQRGVFDPARLDFRSIKKKLYLGLIEKPILRRASTLIALTEAEVDSYRALGVNTPCRVIPNGIDTASYSADHDPGLLRALGIRDDHCVVLFMGRIHPIKGADLLLDAFAQVQSRFPSALLVLAGPDEFGLQEEFRQRSAAAGMADRVVFPGMVSGALKSSLLGRADLFCLPSAAEGFSMAVLEALASQCAVLLSPGCNFPEVVAARAGRVCERTVPAITAELESLLADRAELREIGRRGRELVKTRYDWQTITDQFIDAYEQARAAGGAARATIGETSSSAISGRNT